MRSEPARQRISLESLLQLMDAAFSQGGAFRFYPTGKSMVPFLREGRDLVELVSPRERPPKRGDVVFYRRADGRAVLHRIVGRDAGGFLLCGDRQSLPEPGISPGQILGVASRFVRGRCAFSADAWLYRCYAAVWMASRPARHALGSLRRKLLPRNEGRGNTG